MNGSNIRTEEVPTEHGETVEVEVVDCCSCKQTVPVERTALAVVMHSQLGNLLEVVTKKVAYVSIVEVTQSSGLNDAG